MEETANTECLRSLAPQWNLAGDKKLLILLQDIHKKIMTRCQETSTKLEKMAIALDGANIDLQNVNNKFMALSNSQFIESRVYDDDLEVTVEDKSTKAVTAPSTTQNTESEMSMLKQSLKILESMHESVRILDSDSDSDSDECDGRMVFRPKNMYASRPLPYIIGSQAWKSKWHAGIIAEDSDSDSASSKPEDEMLEQYSESESELTDTGAERLNPPQRTISSNSSMAESEPSVPAAPVSQANIAAELARKLGGNLPEIPVRTPELEPEFTKPHVTPSQMYKPQKPPTSTIFFDEPPPIDQIYQSDGDDDNDEEDDDIFAELHKTKPSLSTNKDQTRLNEDLFGNLNTSPGIAGDLFGAEEKVSTVQKNNVEQSRETDKKPVGGISVFGTSKGTESIGAAILKRNQRKTYSSDEESENDKGMVVNKQYINNTQKDKINTNVRAPRGASKVEPNSIINTDKNEVEPMGEKPNATKPEKNILQDIFDKNKPSKPKNDDKQETVSKEKTDLFSDNLFDDIDDIFTDTIVKVPAKNADKNVKSIFDDDDDDLFADIAVTSSKVTISQNTDNATKGLFDSDNDDNLFSETGDKSSENVNKSEDNVRKIENIATKKTKEAKSIFDDESDEDLFSEIKVKKSSDTDIKKDSSIFESNKEKEIYRHLESSRKMEIEKDDDEDNYLFSETTAVINNTNQESTSQKDEDEIEVSTTTKQIHKIVSDDKFHNNISHDNEKVSLMSHAQTSDLANKTNIDDEMIDDSLNQQEHIIGDDWNDSNFMYENVIESTEDVDSEDIRTEITKYSPVENQFENSKESELNNDIGAQSKNNLQAAPIEDISTSSEVKINSDFNTLDLNMEDTPLPTQPNEISSKPDIFSDIFNDVPPAFEKPKEPKKSKNVNALFDDDSDDEALFFKKSDTISDEKPDLSSIAKEDNLFRIFSDEPPAIDIDFTQKITQSQRNETEDGIQHDLLIPKDPIKKTNKDNNEHILPSKTKALISEDETDKIANTEIKQSIGKLKSMNINIDVNKLLPGASPKKSKVIEEVNRPSVSKPSVDTEIDVENSETNLVKTVSFDDEADSELLDNKLSKERAKIQVKRRPSTRKARREAVKKSGIDFVSSDITDNTNGVYDAEAATVKGTIQDTLRETIKDSPKTSKELNVKSKLVYILNDEDIFSNVNPNKTVPQTVEAAVSIQKDNSQQLKTDNNSDDEDDIFRKIKVAKSETSHPPASQLTGKSENQRSKNFSSADNILQSKTDKENQNVSIKTVNKSEKSIKTKSSIFDDLSDEETELFKGKKTNTPKTNNIFGSDSDEALFAKAVKKPTENKEVIQQPTNVRVEVKKSLFDDDSDDGLFSSKGSGGSGNKPIFSKTSEIKPTQTQSVDEDPLSLLTNDDISDDI